MHKTLRKAYRDIGFAKIDIDRAGRRGFPEVVYGLGKSKFQLREIVKEFIDLKQPLLITKTSRAVFAYLKKFFPRLSFNSKARLIYQSFSKASNSKGYVAIVTGGTSDVPVAEEAHITLELMGSKVKMILDAGVAGVHRLLDNLDILRNARVVIVVAGMEGALASLVSGLVSACVIAVPTSCGYGASFNGIGPLLTMLNSCSPGVAVVNIDNGFGAGYFAGLINRI